MTTIRAFWPILALAILPRIPMAAAQIGVRSYDCENIPNCRDRLREGTRQNNAGEHQRALEILREAFAMCESKSGAETSCKDPRLTFEFARASQYTLGCSAALPQYQAAKRGLVALPMLLRDYLDGKIANQLAEPECQNALEKAGYSPALPPKRPETTEPAELSPAQTMHNHICNFNDVRIDGNQSVINMCGGATRAELSHRNRTLKIVGGVLGSAMFLAIAAGAAAGIYYHYNPRVPAGTTDLPWWQSMGRGLHVSF